MNVLVACEFSGIVRDAFIDEGHNATSCDLLPCERDRPWDTKAHIQGDVLDVLYRWKWDLLIAHPPCTYLCNSGVLRLYKDGKKANGRDGARWTAMRKAAIFFRTLLEAKIPKICIENPVMHGHGRTLVGERHTQLIQPWQFGHPESKATCLWLKNLPPLQPTKILTMPNSGHWDNQTPSGQNKLGPSPTRGQDRARTYAGIAQAMAEQWG